MSKEVLNPAQFGSLNHKFEVGKTYRVTYRNSGFNGNMRGTPDTFTATYLGVQMVQDPYRPDVAKPFHEFTNYNSVGDHHEAVYSEVGAGGKRSAEQREKDRQGILGNIGENWDEAPMGASASDMAALEKAGHIESRVGTRYQRVATRSGAFGGHVSVQRKYKEYRRRQA